MRPPLRLCLCVLAVLAPATALADAGDATRSTDTTFTPQAAGNRVWLDLEALPAGAANIFTLALNGQYQVHRNIVLNLELPAAAGQVVGEPAAHVAPGNITVGLRGVGAIRPSLILWAGFSFSFPTIHSIPATNDGLAESNIAALASATRGAYDPERFMPEIFTPRVDFGLEVGFERRWRYRFDISSYLEVPAGPDVAGFAVSSDVVESSSELQVELARHVYLGARLQFVLLWPAVAGGLFLGYEPPGEGFQCRLDWLIGSISVFGDEYSGDYYSAFGLFNTVALRVGYKF